MLEELAQDILDVALNAATAGASRVAIRLSEDVHRDRLSITIADNGKGMDAGLREQVLDGFVTTKVDGSKPLGLGIALLREAADLCEGRFRLFSQEGRGTIVSVSMRHSHIDRPPLGDLAASITALCCTESGMRVLFEHRCGERTFVFDSALLRIETEGGGMTAALLLEIERIVNEGEERFRTLSPESFPAELDLASEVGGHSLHT